MGETLVQTPNGTFVTSEVAKAAGLEAKAERKAAPKRKAATAASKSPAARKAAGASRKGKR